MFVLMSQAVKMWPRLTVASIASLAIGVAYGHVIRPDPTLAILFGISLVIAVVAPILWLFQGGQSQQLQIHLKQLVEEANREEEGSGTTAALPRNLGKVMQVVADQFEEARAHARVLQYVGLFLTVMGVVAPFLSWWAYITHSALPVDTVVRLRELQAAGLPLPQVELQPADWHILVAGLSLGFLFLAAARSLFRRASDYQEDARDLLMRVVAVRNVLVFIAAKEFVFVDDPTAVVQLVLDALRGSPEPRRRSMVGRVVDAVRDAAQP